MQKQGASFSVTKIANYGCGYFCLKFEIACSLSEPQLPRICRETFADMFELSFDWLFHTLKTLCSIIQRQFFMS